MALHSDESRARIDLTAALRSASRLGLGEGICNHFSLALPASSSTPGHFLINPQGLHWSEITPADLVVVDAQGHKVAGKHSVEPTAFFIHSAIHRGNANARCVMHTHMPYATALTVVNGGRLEWASQNALKFYHRVAYDDHYNGLALDDAEGARMCGEMGDADVLFLGNHGVIVCVHAASAGHEYRQTAAHGARSHCRQNRAADEPGKPAGRIAS